jgi:hypothetical protein
MIGCLRRNIITVSIIRITSSAALFDVPAFSTERGRLWVQTLDEVRSELNFKIDVLMLCERDCRCG